MRGVKRTHFEPSFLLGFLAVFLKSRSLRRRLRAPRKSAAAPFCAKLDSNFLQHCPPIGISGARKQHTPAANRLAQHRLPTVYAAQFSGRLFIGTLSSWQHSSTFVSPPKGTKDKLFRFQRNSRSCASTPTESSWRSLPPSRRQKPRGSRDEPCSQKCSIGFPRGKQTAFWRGIPTDWHETPLMEAPSFICWTRACSGRSSSPQCLSTVHRMGSSCSKSRSDRANCMSIN